MDICGLLNISGNFTTNDRLVIQTSTFFNSHEFHTNDLICIKNYSYHNPSYIDIFCHYLCSRLVEDDIIPNFPLFYGAVNTYFEKYLTR